MFSGILGKSSIRSLMSRAGSCRLVRAAAPHPAAAAPPVEPITAAQPCSMGFVECWQQRKAGQHFSSHGWNREGGGSACSAASSSSSDSSSGSSRSWRSKARSSPHAGMPCNGTCIKYAPGIVDSSGSSGSGEMSRGSSSSSSSGSITAGAVTQ